MGKSLKQTITKTLLQHGDFVGWLMQIGMLESLLRGKGTVRMSSVQVEWLVLRTGQEQPTRIYSVQQVLSKRSISKCKLSPLIRYSNRAVIVLI